MIIKKKVNFYQFEDDVNQKDVICAENDTQAMEYMVNLIGADVLGMTITQLSDRSVFKIKICDDDGKNARPAKEVILEEIERYGLPCQVFCNWI